MLARPAAVLCALCTALALLAAAPVAHGASKAPRLTGLRCVPVTTPSCRQAVRVKVGSQIQLRGRNLTSGMRVTFRWSRGALATKLRRGSVGWSARVPAGTATGRVAVTVRDRARRRSNARNIIVVASSPARAPALAAGALPIALRGNAMWIWQLPQSNGGNLDVIAARARAAGMSTVYVKSSDAADEWAQFTPQLVTARTPAACASAPGSSSTARIRSARRLPARQPSPTAPTVDHRRRDRIRGPLRVGAALHARAARRGRRELPARHDLVSLRRLPPGLSVFGLPRARRRAGQHAAGLLEGDRRSVDAVSAKTVAQNRIYKTPMAPVGQAYNGPSSADLQRFRAIWAGYGVGGISWWSWQSSSAATWLALTQPPPAAVVLADPGWPALRSGSKGDQVIWLQQHLASFEPALEVLAGGRFTAQTDAALKRFQTARGLPPSGTTDAVTWQALLALPVRPVDWTAIAPAAVRAAALASAR